MAACNTVFVLSVPQLVKKISPGLAFMICAISFRDFSMAIREALPKEWIEDAFPKCSVR
jgi:hypothetical protein